MEQVSTGILVGYGTILKSKLNASDEHENTNLFFEPKTTVFLIDKFENLFWMTSHVSNMSTDSRLRTEGVVHIFHVLLVEMFTSV